jgi:WD40 repeat protein
MCRGDGMSRVFLSHSSRDNRQAVAVKKWLIEQEPGLAEEIFLDLDPHTGIRPGQRWKEALNQANTRCEAVICLLSQHWNRSHECAAEYRHAESLHKTILCARLEPVPDTGITSEWQRCDLFPGDSPVTQIGVDGGEPVVLDAVGLQRLLQALRALGIGAEHFPWPPPGDADRAPYRGWAPLEEVDAAVFFGRDAQILRGLDVLHGMRSSGVESLFVILGPSGTGKSSFLRAGLLPRLGRDDRRFLPMDIVRPERAVLTGELGLAHAIYELRSGLGLREPLLGEIKNACHPEQVERLRGWLAEARAAARARLLDVPAEQPAPTLVLPVDQTEELFNADAGAEAPRFLELLAALIEREAGVTPTMIVALTIRADRYEPLQVAPELAEVKTALFDDLRPLPPAGYKEVITGPARRASAAGRRLTIEPALVERVLADTAEGADALPLLALTLERLYHDFGDGGQLSLAHYESMGGMAQIVQNEVDNLLAAHPEQRQADLDTLHDAFIPWLAAINPDSDQPMRRLARWDDLPAASRSLIQAMVEKRLLVKDTRDGQVVVEVALESFLRQWRELAAWLRDEAQDLKDADNLERAARAWAENGCGDEWLLSGSRLADAESLAAQPGFRERLNTTREFLLASRQHEDQRLAEERRRHEAELVAAQALATAEGRAKEEAQRHASVLRRRTHILRAVLALVVVAALAAGFLFVRASRAEEKAVASLRNATATSLMTNSQLMLAGTYPGVADDVLAMQLLLAARSIPSNINADFSLLNAVNQQRDVLKIAHTNGDSYSVAFSPDGKRLAVADGDSIELWNTETWHRIGYLTGHKAEVLSVAFSPDGRRIVSSSNDGTLRLWNAESRQLIGAPMRGQGAGSGSISAVAFSPDGGRIISGGAEKTLRLWDAGSRLPIGEPMRGHAAEVASIAFSPNGRLIASGGLDSTLRLWDADTRAPLAELSSDNQKPVLSVAFSPDGRRIVSASGTTLQRWDVATRMPVGEPLQGHTAAIDQVVYSRDGTRIASAGDDKTIRLWDAATGSPIGEPLVGHEYAIFGLAFDADGRRIASSSHDRTFRVWDARGAQVFHGHQDGVNGIDFSPDGKRIVSSSMDRTIRQWDGDTGIQTGPLIRTGDVAAGMSDEGLVERFQKNVYSRFSADGGQIIGIGPRTNRAWDAATGMLVAERPTPPPGTTLLAYTDVGHKFATLAADGDMFSGLPVGTDVQVRDEAMRPIGGPLHSDHNVTVLALSRDGHRIATGATDFKVRIWDADTGRPIGAPLEHDSTIATLKFSRDGHTLAVADFNQSARLWDVETGKPIGTPMHQDGLIIDVAFSPDGRLLATAGGDNSVRLWDVKSQTAIGSALAGHTQPVVNVKFSPDGSKVASASVDRTIRVWPVPTASPDKLCAKMTSNMSRKTWDTWIPPATHIPYTALCPGLPIADDGN